MSTDDSPPREDALRNLAHRLQNLPQVSALDARDHNEAWVLVHAITDLRESARVYLERSDALFDPGLTGQALLEELFSVMDELQHLLYHLVDPHFFRASFAPLLDAWLAESSEIVPDAHDG